MSPPTRTDARQLDHAEVVAGPDPVEDALVHRRHELAVAVQHAVRADDQQRVVERARAVVLALVDADGEVDATVGAGLGQAVDQRSVDVDARRPQPLPELVGRRRPRRRRRRPTRRSGTATRSTRGRRPGWRRRPPPPPAGRSPCRRSPRHRGSPAWPAPPPPARSRRSPRSQATPIGSGRGRRGAPACAGRVGCRSTARVRPGRRRSRGRPRRRGSATNGA